MLMAPVSAQVLNTTYISQPQVQMMQPQQIQGAMMPPPSSSMGPPPLREPLHVRPPSSSRNGPIGAYPDLVQSPQSAQSQPLGAPYSAAPGPLPTIPATHRPSSSGNHQHERSFSHSSAYSQSNSILQQQPPPPQQQQPQQQYPVRNSAQAPIPSSRFNSSISSLTQAPPQLGPCRSKPRSSSSSSSSSSSNRSSNRSRLSSSRQRPTPLAQHPPTARPGSSGVASGMAPQGRNQSPPQLAPARPIFGVSLSRLYERDGMAVPMVVIQCIQAVDLYGLALEGIYRLSGSVPHVNTLKNMFDTGERRSWQGIRGFEQRLTGVCVSPDSSSANLDFRNPENFFHDVNSVAGLLKQFFRDLPDPILTREHYAQLIESASRCHGRFCLSTSSFFPNLRRWPRNRRRLGPARLAARHHQRAARPQLRHAARAGAPSVPRHGAVGHQPHELAEPGHHLRPHAHGQQPRL